MEWIEVTSPSVEEAKETALDRLGVAADEVEFDVVDEGVRGMFGRVKTPARVRARVRPRIAPEKANRRQRSGRSNDKGSREARQSDRNRSGSNRAKPAAKDSEGSKNSSGRNSGNGGNGNGGGGNGGQRRSAAAKQTAATQASTNGGDNAPKGEATVTQDELAKIGIGLLDGLVAAMGLSATATVTANEDRLDFTLAGDNLGLLIGQGGRTADGLQEIVRAVLLRAADGDAPYRIGLDVGGYRQLRSQALAQFGTEQAQRAVDSGTTLVFEPMGSPDRKVLHDAVQSVEGATSSSEGAGDSRRVVIHPAG